ncbi:uncharacterized protein LOC106648165 [Trichogramma pretiosum]|uniref:uncharacterized protein LOC106648165 n=1 Tax=Trichogramma pretiosum TaxID=7493 RepID=UPI000C71C8EC|nr:uncharacterized protein LOC106648165 [Trichogramma pretiosum]
MKQKLLLLLFASYNLSWAAYTYQKAYTVQEYQYPVMNQYQTQGSYGSNNMNTYQLTYNTGSVYSMPPITYVGVPMYKQYLIRKTYETSVPVYISKSTADISNLNRQNTNQILKIFFNLNVGEDVKQNIHQLLTLDANANGTYTQYIYQLILQIISLNVNDDAKRTIINLLNSRIQGLTTNGGSNASEEQSIINQIGSLNIDESNKQQLVQILVSNFKGPQNQISIHSKTQTGTIINKDNNDEYTMNQNIEKAPDDISENFNANDLNKKKIMEILVEENVDENTRNKLLEILAADSNADGAYTQYILELVSRINSWDISADVRKRVLQLLAFRILQYQTNGGYSDADIVSVKNEIDNLNTTKSWKNRILECLIMEFKGFQLRATNVETTQPGSQNNIAETEYPNEKDENQRKIKEIMNVKNVNKNMQNKLLELLAIDSNADGAYTQYILHLVSQIVSWDVKEDVQQKVLELLCLRVLQFQDHGEYTQNNDQLIKNEVLQLNTTDLWKNKINQFLLNDFKGLLLQVESSMDFQGQSTLPLNLNESLYVGEGYNQKSNRQIQNQGTLNTQESHTNNVNLVTSTETLHNKNQNPVFTDKQTSNEESHNQGNTNIQVSTPNNNFANTTVITTSNSTPRKNNANGQVFNTNINKIGESISTPVQKDLKPMMVSAPIQDVSQKNKIPNNNSNEYGENGKKIVDLLTKKNVNEEMKKKLLELLAVDSKGNGAYTSYILELITQIEGWNINVNVKRRVLEILIDRILKYQVNGGYSDADIQTIKNEIEKLNESRSWKNIIFRYLIIDFKGQQLQSTGTDSSQNNVQKTVIKSKTSNQNDENIQKIYNILVLKNVNSDARNSLLKLLTDHIEDTGYTQYILQVITKIINSEITDDIQGQVLHLLVLRILQYELNGGSTEADEKLIKSQIEQLKTTSYWKNIITRYLITDFKGHLYQVKGSGPSKNLPQAASVQGVSQKNQDQLENYSQYGEHVQNVMKILIERKIDENTRNRLLTILVSDTEAGGTYTDYILNVINQIISWDVSSNTQKKILELLIFRIVQYQKNGKYSDADIISVKNEIEQLKISRKWKNIILNFLIIYFKGVYLERRYYGTAPDGSRKVVLQARYSEEKEENRQKIMEIMIVKSVNEDMQKKLLDIIIDDSTEGVAYTQYILQLMIQIVSWDISNDIQTKMIELLIFRICQFEINGGSTQADEQSIRTQISQLDTTESWKNRFIQFLILNFKGQLLHAKSSRSDNSQSNTIQTDKLNVNEGNEGSCIGSCSGSTQYLPHTDCSKFCQCSNGQPIVMPCPATLQWDTKINNCNYPSQVQCPNQGGQNQIGQASTQDSVQTTVTENQISNSGSGNEGSCIGSCSGSTQYLPHADCSKFCQCSNGQPIVMPCPATLQWDTKINNCNYPSQVQCPNQGGQNQIGQASSQDSVQTTVTENHISNSGSGNEGSCIGSCSGSTQYLPHADCSKFCQCSNGQPVVMPCPATLQWDTKINNCNYPSQVQCPR